MKENIVTFQVAKLAKEKGFTLQTNPFGYVTKFYRPSTKTLLSYGRTGRSKLNTLIYAPTQSLLQRWLREVHGIHIDIRMIEDEEDYEKTKWAFQVVTKNLFGGVEYEDFNSYEEALEAGLSEALKLIKI